MRVFRRDALESVTHLCTIYFASGLQEILDYLDSGFAHDY